MASFVAGKNSSIGCIMNVLCGVESQVKPVLKHRVSKEYQDEFDAVIEKTVERIGNRFRRMIVNKRAIQENMDNLNICVSEYEKDVERELIFYLDTMRFNRFISKNITNGTLISSDEFYNALEEKLNEVFKSSSQFIQNKLYDIEHKVKVVKAEKYISVSPRIRFVYNKIYITASVFLV